MTGRSTDKMIRVFNADAAGLTTWEANRQIDDAVSEVRAMHAMTPV